MKISRGGGGGGELFFDNLKKSLVEIAFYFHLQLRDNKPVPEQVKLSKDFITKAGFLGSLFKVKDKKLD